MSTKAQRITNQVAVIFTLAVMVGGLAAFGALTPLNVTILLVVAALGSFAGSTVLVVEDAETSAR